MIKSQILIIHGGNTFKNKADYLQYLKTKEIRLEKRKSWAGDYFDKELSKKYQIIRPRMPLQDNAKYEDWKIWFERHIPHLRNNIILIGSSLGGIFLAKYLSENLFPKKISAVFLVCPPFNSSLPNEDLVGGFKLKSDLSLIEQNSKNIFLMFSEDDDVVPVSHSKKYAEKLPKSKIMILKHKNGHFKITKFPEIIRCIKMLK